MRLTLFSAVAFLTASATAGIRRPRDFNASANQNVTQVASSPPSMRLVIPSSLVIPPPEDPLQRRQEPDQEYHASCIVVKQHKKHKHHHRFECTSDSLPYSPATIDCANLSPTNELRQLAIGEEIEGDCEVTSMGKTPFHPHILECSKKGEEETRALGCKLIRRKAQSSR